MTRRQLSDSAWRRTAGVLRWTSAVADRPSRNFSPGSASALFSCRYVDAPQVVFLAILKKFFLQEFDDFRKTGDIHKPDDDTGLWNISTKRRRESRIGTGKSRSVKIRCSWMVSPRCLAWMGSSAFHWVVVWRSAEAAHHGPAP